MNDKIHFDYLFVLYQHKKSMKLTNMSDC